MKLILTEPQLAITIKRLAHQVLENNINLDNTVLIGLQPRGIFFSDQLVTEIKKELPSGNVHYGKLDITFYRDDIRKGLHVANHTNIPFSIEGKKVILIDDVLYTGRTIRAALDALLDFWPTGKGRKSSGWLSDQDRLPLKLSIPGELRSVAVQLQFYHQWI
ncbi:MAG: phosphoribosyltransferase family protein [Bacteroidota bacterium]